MSDQKISTLLALSLLSAPLILPASPSSSKTISTEATSPRASARRMKHQLNVAPTLQPRGTYVGELQEKWQFPSDHLPIGITFDGIHIASWNVLDSDSMHWVIEKNSQGLSHSLIADEHAYIGNSTLTVRDQHVVDLILKMITHPTHPRSLLSLQECSPAFLEELRAHLPPYFEIISNQDRAVLIDQRLFEIHSANTISGLFEHEPQETIQDITVRRLDNQKLLRLINAHLPGDPTKPARFEFGEYLKRTFDPNLMTIAMGDMNFNELEMADAIKDVPSLSIHTPYCTNISPRTFTSKAIDHFFTYSPESAQAQLSQPHELLPTLGATIALLQKSDYIHPSFSNHIDAPLPVTTDSDQLLGIYGNILYPQDKEQLQQKKLADWIEAYEKDPTAPFPLSPEEINDVSFYILDRFALKTIGNYFTKRMQNHLASGKRLENALTNASQETLIRAQLYKEMAKKIPAWKGRCETLIARFTECADQVDQIIQRNTQTLQEDSDKAVVDLLKWTSTELIEPPLTWEMRTEVLRQMVDKVTSLSPNAPYFLALQEVTPQALGDLKKTLADRDLQWISFNNLSGRETLEPEQEDVLGEATAFTSTLAISRDLEILKVELGDLPTESGSVRKILGVRVHNPRTNKVFNLFTTHTDHKIQNDIYARTAGKIHEFATRFFQDMPDEKRFVMGGDLNVFDQSGGDKYVEKLRELFSNSQDFRETDYYAPKPIAWSSFIGRYDDTYSKRLAIDGIVEPSALDQVLVGNGVELQAASKEALVYNPSGQILDYYQNPAEYFHNLQKRITFSDHLFNIVRFK